MAVQKAVDLTGSGPSLEDAVGDALDRASMTLDGVTRFELVGVTGSVDGGITYEAQVRVWFTLLERVHG
jgi:flavin-binding protein dodecin